MALGESYNNNKQNYSPTVYSQYKLSNTDSKVDATTINFTYWNSMLKISIAPLKPSNDGSIAFDYDKEVAIYINHTKARILASEIINFKADPNAFNNVGINSGNGIIGISNGKEFGVSTPIISIRQVNNETGETTSSAAYEFKTGYHYAIRNFEESKFEFDKAYYDNIELDQFITLLESYYEAMSGAMAYSVIDNNKYETARLTGKITAVGEKLGVEFGKKGNYGKSSNSIFNQKGNKENSYSSSSIEDIENQIG